MTDHTYADEIAELRDAYPEGCVVEVETKDGQAWRGRVTGHSEIVNDGQITYKNPGARLLVATNPPDAERVEDHGLDVEGRAAQVPKERIHGRVDDA